MGVVDVNIQGQSAIFCLSGSPFQAMCMIEAIKAYDIKDYKVMLCLSNNELPRMHQLAALLNKYNITFEIESIDFRITKIERIRAMLPTRKKYKLAFIGDCNNELLIFKAFRYISDGGTMVYLDDGIATIQFFNGLCQLSNKLRHYYNVICKIRDINFDKYFYTIYHDLGDGKHITLANDFNYFASLMRGKQATKKVLLLGTCTNDYCRMENINPEVFLGELRNLMSELKCQYPGEEIVYVPHGRETYPEPKQYCEELGIEFCPTSISVEMMVLDASYRPKAVYGYTSSALYNLNLLLPDSDVCNVSFTGNTPGNDRIEITSSYYEKHGIRRLIKPLTNNN